MSEIVNAYFDGRRYRVGIVTPAAADPVSISEAKLHCRIDETADNATVAALVKAATAVCENYMRRPIMTQEFRQQFDQWPCSTFLELARAPLISVTSVNTYNEADVATLFAASNYYVDAVTLPGRIVLRGGVSWPQWSRYANPIEVIYKAGYGTDPNAIPAEIRQAVLATIAWFYENRGDAMADMPEIACVLLAGHRDWAF